MQMAIRPPLVNPIVTAPAVAEIPPTTQGTSSLVKAVTTRPELYAFVITLVCVIGAVVLTAMNKTVPDNLWLIGGGAGLGGLGAMNPSRGV